MSTVPGAWNALHMGTKIVVVALCLTPAFRWGLGLGEWGPDQLLLPAGQLKFIHDHGVRAWWGDVLTPAADREVQVSPTPSATLGLGCAWVSSVEVASSGPCGFLFPRAEESTTSQPPRNKTNTVT